MIRFKKELIMYIEKIKNANKMIRESLPFTRGNVRKRLLKTVAALRIADVLCSAYIAEEGKRS